MAKKTAKKAAKKDNKKQSRKETYHSVLKDGGWNVMTGKLVPGKGRPELVESIFEVIAEKIPYAALGKCEADMKKYGYTAEGVCLAHDSMGVARYGGRGDIYVRLAAHLKKYPRELAYFSFYTIKDKKHEREIETVILRAAGPQLILNERKVRDDIEKGDVRDYEPGTEFYERQKVRGKKKKK
jgi:hypothetical protein